MMARYFASQQQYFASQPARTSAKLAKLEHTVGDPEGPHKLADWLVDLRNFVSVKYPLGGEGALAKCLKEAERAHETWCDAGPTQKAHVMPNEPDYEEQEAVVVQQMTTDVVLNVPRSIATWATQAASARQGKRRLEELFFKIRCAMMPRSFEARDAARELLENPERIRSTQLELWLLTYKEKLHRLESVGIVEEHSDSYARFFKAVKQTVQEAHPNAEFMLAFRSFMLAHPPPTKIRSEYFYSFWDKLHEVAHNYYPAEAAPELQGKTTRRPDDQTTRRPDNQQALAVDGQNKRGEKGDGGKGNSKMKDVECRMFASSGTCRYGEKCRFTHGTGGTKPDVKKTNDGAKGKGKGGGAKIDAPCFHFRDKGECPFGNKCRFNHTAGPGSGGRKPPAGGGGTPP
jgi:hypothetical protein